MVIYFFFFFQAEDGIRDIGVTGVQTCALPILSRAGRGPPAPSRPGRQADTGSSSYGWSSRGVPSRGLALDRKTTGSPPPRSSVPQPQASPASRLIAQSRVWPPRGAVGHGDQGPLRARAVEFRTVRFGG